MAIISAGFQDYLNLWRDMIPETIGRMDPTWPWNQKIHSDVFEMLRGAAKKLVGREGRVARADIRWYKSQAIGIPVGMSPSDAVEFLRGVEQRTQLALLDNGAHYLNPLDRYKFGITRSTVNACLFLGALVLFMSTWVVFYRPRVEQTQEKND